VRPGLAEVAGGLLMLRVIVETVSMAFAGMITFVLGWALLKLTGRRAR
jgi:hypothetical protein